MDQNKLHRKGSSDLPLGWDRGIDNYGHPYYVDMVSGRVQKERPSPNAGHRMQDHQRIDSSYDRDKHLFIDPEQWDIVIDTMAASIHPNDQIRVFEKLKKIAEKMVLKDDPKYRQLYLNNSKLRKSVLVFDGGLEFLYNLGFEPNPTDPERLICHKVDPRVVQACLLCLGDKVESLRDSQRDREDFASHAEPLHPQDSFDPIDTSDVPSNLPYYRGQQGNQYGEPDRGPDSPSGNVKIPENNRRQKSSPVKSRPEPLMERVEPRIVSEPYHSPILIPITEAQRNPPPLFEPEEKKKDFIRPYEHRQSKPRNHGSVEKGPQNEWRVIIFIRHGTSIWNASKMGGKKWQAVGRGLYEYWKTKNKSENHKDTLVVDAPLAKAGIDEAFGLSRFLSRHFLVRQMENYEQLQRHKELLTPLQNGLLILKSGLIDKYSGQMSKNSDLLIKLQEVYNHFNTTHTKIQQLMRKLEGHGQAEYATKGSNEGDLETQHQHHSSHHSYSRFSSMRMSGNFEYIMDAKRTERKKDLLRIMSAEAHEVEDPHEEAKVDEHVQRPFAHVVLNGPDSFASDEDDADLPLEVEWVLDELVDSHQSSIVTCSNLRRAISTAIIGLWDRFGANSEKMHILPCLQELGMNVDTHTPVVDTTPQLSQFEKDSNMLNVDKLSEFYSDRLIVQQVAAGKKSLRESTQDAQIRMQLFVDWAFKQEDKRTVIAVGHSHWFRHFFKTYLPPDAEHPAAKRKMYNCGVVAFRMLREITHEQLKTKRYYIKPGSITPIYRGFQ